ncbi:plancitoxin-1-like [Saccostrea echinata]|uniref:plancitoxin-1-like n=1 Tax=Saccostrea echinata TaxID=191078 RepID=UPI002A7F5B38|nr:plancitoxin-1-like [Saccostrea echinata]
MNTHFLILFSVIFLLYAENVLSLGCKSPGGTSVDWFMLYKIPRNTKKNNEEVRGGEKFYYLDANSNPKKLNFYDADIRGQTNNSLYHTLQQIYNGESTKHAIYNDQPPESKTCKNFKESGHLKGATAFNKEEGFWMISSIPRFPLPKKYEYGGGQLLFGQSVLCITFGKNYLDKIVEAFSITKPCIYDGNITFGMSSDLSKEFLFTSKGGTTFRYFGKSNNYKGDLYANFVAEKLMDNLKVETWRSEDIDGFSSSCGDYKVLNVKEVIFNDGFEFRSSKDHSKWAVTEKKSWICIGDLNRADSQCKRGGGTMCLEHKDVSEHYRSLIKSYEECGNKRQKSDCSFDDNYPRKRSKVCPKA